MPLGPLENLVKGMKTDEIELLLRENALSEDVAIYFESVLADRIRHQCSSQESHAGEQPQVLSISWHKFIVDPRQAPYYGTAAAFSLAIAPFLDKGPRSLLSIVGSLFFVAFAYHSLTLAALTLQRNMSKAYQLASSILLVVGVAHLIGLDLREFSIRALMTWLEGEINVLGIVVAAVLGGYVLGAQAEKSFLPFRAFMVFTIAVGFMSVLVSPDQKAVGAVSYVFVMVLGCAAFFFGLFMRSRA